MKRHNYFAYGANVNQEYFKSQFPDAELIGVGVVPDHAIIFNKPSTDGSGKASIIPSAAFVEGLLWSLPEEAFKKLDKIESGYNKVKLMVHHYKGGMYSNEPEGILAVTYLARSLNPHVLPNDTYMTKIIVGATDNKFLPDYIKSLRKIPIMTYVNLKPYAPVEF